MPRRWGLSLPDVCRRDNRNNGTSIHVGYGVMARQVVMLHGFGTTATMWVIGERISKTMVVAPRHAWVGPLVEA